MSGNAHIHSLGGDLGRFEFTFRRHSTVAGLKVGQGPPYFGPPKSSGVVGWALAHLQSCILDPSEQARIRDHLHGLECQ